MVTISRTRTERPHGISILWRIILAFLLIIGISFAVMANRLTQYVSQYLYEQRIRQDSVSVERLAVTVAPLFASGNAQKLNETLSAAGGEMNGRLMVIDRDGKVQFDSYQRMFGMRLELPEVLSILVGGDSVSYGIHQVTEENTDMGEEGMYVAYFASGLVGSQGTLGLLLYISEIAEMIESLNQVERQLLTIFVIVAAAALVAAVLVARLISRPMSAITKSIQKMGKGDLSVRVPVKGSSELRRLAISYNNMAEQLEALDRGRNQFVSNASHELKTPMTTMKILLENVLYDPDMPVELRSEFLQDMNHEIDRLTNIVTDLLTLTQMDNRKMKLTIVQTNLSETAEEVVRMLQPQAEKRGQHLVGRITPNVFLPADVDKMTQVIYNLTENAIKYTPDGGRILVMLQTKGRYAVLTVQDNGVGIPEEDQAHIFERFYRVDKARSRESGGTGLGLSIVRQLVTLHGGRVSVQSVPGRGSLFTVALPLDGKEAAD